MAFYDDLEFGNRFERMSLQDLDPYESVEFPPEGIAHKEWDYKVFHKDGRVETYECKADRKCVQTGNFFIETHNKYGEPSGLTTTKADTYILMKVSVCGKHILQSYFVPTEVMREFQSSRKFLIKTQPTRGFLLTERALIDYYNKNK
jgi:hypothetical protein